MSENQRAGKNFIFSPAPIVQSFAFPGVSIFKPAGAIHLSVKRRLWPRMPRILTVDEHDPASSCGPLFLCRGFFVARRDRNRYDGDIFDVFR